MKLPYPILQDVSIKNNRHVLQLNIAVKTLEKGIEAARQAGPIVNMAKAVETLKPLGFVDKSDSVPWREAYCSL